MTKRNIYAVLLMLVALGSYAEVPENYYSTINGEKYLALKAKLNSIISEHKVLGYNNLWAYYPYSYYHQEHKTQVLDMYSDIERWYNGAGTVISINREHTVPQSWWGGGTTVAQGNDLFNVIPADATANTWKSNSPLGVVETVQWTNGCTTVGKSMVEGAVMDIFEPDDRYKGDFARIYFYMAVRYPSVWTEDAYGMSSDSEQTLKSWIIPTLIAWNNMDPVDETEIQRNEDVAAIQGNRNPFIDYPELVEYIWGSKTDEAFDLQEHKANDGATSPLRASLPSFSILGGTEEAPKTLGRGTVLTITGGVSRCVLHVRIDGGEWTEINYTTIVKDNGHKAYEAAETKIEINNDTHVEAYCTYEGREESWMMDYYYKVIDYDEGYLLYEPFDEISIGDNITTSGSTLLWGGNTNFPEITRAYNAGAAVKLGGSSGGGSITSRPLETLGGKLNVQMEVKGWTTVETDFAVTLTGSEPQTVKYTATIADDWETISLDFDNVSPQPVLSISTTKKRGFINTISVSEVTTAAVMPTIITTPTDNVYYSVTGIRFRSCPTKRGLYIINGRKVVY